MKKSKLLFLFVLIFFISNSVVYAQEPKILDNYILDKNIEPTYNLVVNPSYVSVDRKESIKMSIHTVGYGYVKKNKLSIFIPSDLLNEADPGMSIHYIDCVHYDNKTFAKFNPSFGPADLREVSFTECSFMWDQSTVENTFKDFVPPVSIGEDYSLLDLHLNISDDAPQGDNKIRFVLSYSMDGSIWNEDEEEVNIHVNSWLEGNQFRPIVLLVTLTVFVSIVAKFNKWFLKDIHNYFKILYYLIESVVFIALLNIFIDLKLSGRLNFLLAIFSILCLILMVVLIIIKGGKKEEGYDIMDVR